MALDWTTLLIAAGGGLAGWIGNMLQHHYSAEGRFDRRVDERLTLLEKQVEECRKRDGHISVLTLGLKLVVPEVLRLDSGNPVLRHVATALSALPSDNGDFADLLVQLDRLES